LSSAIQSIFDQKYKNWKIILIDDASTDDYLPSIQKFLKDKRVMLIKNSDNQG
jgi:glycosyltransferase involved in cell wall biosynthesis